VPGVRAFCEMHGIEAWLREGGLLRVSAASAQDEAVERHAEAARALGVPDEAVPLSREELAERIRSPRFRKGVLVRDCATVQPARLVRGLRRVAAGRARLHERSRVTKIEDGRVEAAL
jgi:glycine/D-amino acid oxidase-like deaminating enzyme